MTNKTEDKFYFGKPGKPERFADGTESFLTIKGVRYRIVGTRKDARGNLVYDLHGISKTAHPVPFTLVKFLDDGRWVLWGAHGGEVARGKIDFSRPGQPERFAAYGEVNTAAVNREARKYLETLNRVQPDEAHKQLYLQLKQRLQHDIQETQQAAERVKKGSDHPYDFWRISDLHRRMIEAGRYSQEAIRVMSRWIPDAFSRPGQPDKFDASSLDRGNFAEASQSPMLGKLLAAKVMPEGGWRAVQVGSDTLVISFEDADLASDFGRRVATKGYNATSPVQAIGRYWNVEVKNDGK